MSIEKRLSKLEETIAGSNPPAMPLPEATQRLYERAFGPDYETKFAGKTVDELLSDPATRKALLLAEEQLEQEHYRPLRTAGELSLLSDPAELSEGG